MICICRVISVMPSENQLLTKAMVTTCQLPMDYLKQGAQNLQFDRLELLKAISLFTTCANTLSDLPHFSQMECLVPLFTETWPVLKHIMLERQKDCEIVAESSSYVSKSLSNLDMGQWLSP